MRSYQNVKRENHSKDGGSKNENYILQAGDSAGNEGSGSPQERGQTQRGGSGAGDSALGARRQGAGAETASGSRAPTWNRSLTFHFKAKVMVHLSPK